jgi:dihydroorotate dehydrogenase
LRTVAWIGEGFARSVVEGKMPDWFYRTVSQPLLFRLPAIRARDLALGLMGRLARLPLGSAVIDFMGHMRADPRLRCTHRGIEFPTAVGLGPHLDGAAVALSALARFGVGFIEVGPMTIAGGGDGAMERRPGQGAIWSPDPPSSLSSANATARLAESTRLGLPLIARIGAMATDECSRLVRELAPHVHVFSLDTLSYALTAGWSLEQWKEHVRTIVAAAQRPVLVCVPCDLDAERSDPLLDAALSAGAAGLLIDGSVRSETGGRLIGLPAREPALAQVRRLRDRHGGSLFLIAAGGVHEPGDALALRRAGADLVQVDSGLVYSGPGLPKRINDAFLFEATRLPTPPSPPAPLPEGEGKNAAERPAEMSWFWTFLMGAGMLLGSVMALVIAATHVVLPYDETFVGMTRDELHNINPRLLAFMAHDRVSLAGTMVAIGVMYIGLSLFGIRRGQHWAQLSVFVSAFVGFASFFLFLGFEYFDNFHAFVTLALLQLLLLGVHAKLGTHVPSVAPPMQGDAAWYRSLWGQLLLIVHACGLLGAGLMISSIGVTHVFVHEDLDFMQTTAEKLIAANARLVPLVAHDRATFGGMLLASGWVFLLPALWGFRNGSAWLWRTMLIAGAAAYLAAIGVHFAVGYTNIVHLLPAFSGLVVFSVGMGLSYAFLCDGGQKNPSDCTSAIRGDAVTKVTIHVDDPGSPAAQALITQLDALQCSLYPPESLHLASVEELRQADATFLVASVNGKVVGCGAIVNRGSYAELKRMFVLPTCRRLGVGRRILAELEARAILLNVRRVMLETGAAQPEAIGLYERAGYRRRRVYGDYAEDPLTVYMEKELAPMSLADDANC